MTTTAETSTDDVVHNPNPGKVPMTSAYPVEVSTLIERVRDYATVHGLPTQNRIMTEFKVGRPKAATVLAALTASGLTPTTSAPPARRLHAVTADPQVVDPPQQVSPQVTDAADAPPVPNAPATGGTAESAESVAAPALPVVVERSRDGGGRWRSVPLVLLALGAFVSIWGGWVGLGELTGFGEIRLLPGIADGFVINSAITLPLGVEAYAAFALRVWLASSTSARARRFARWSTIASLALGMTGQIAYHLMVAADVTRAPWPITAFVAALPVAVLGAGAALAHLTTHATTDGEN